MNLKLNVNRSTIAISAYLNAKKKKRFTRPPNKIILIVFQQLFGDAVIIQDSLEEYASLFRKDEGYRIILLARPAVAAFMQDTLILPEGIDIEKVDFKKFLEDFSYFREVVKQYRDISDLLIVPGASLAGAIFAAANNARRKIGLMPSMKIERPFIMSLFFKVAYTEEIHPEKKDMMLIRHRKVLEYLGAKDYRAKLPTLKKMSKVINEEHYCVFGPGASKAEKFWPIERFSQVADYVIEKYKFNVHLCGGAEEENLYDLMRSQMKHPERLISHMGKTSFSEWSAIVQFADLVVGNDSATIHMAAAARRKALCINGVYDKYLVAPYQVDVLEEGDILPVYILHDMPCEFCRIKGYYAGYGNKACIKRINTNRCTLCINEITVEEVEAEIDKLIRKS